MRRTFLFFVLAGVSHAMFVQPLLREVPVDRMITNLEKKIEANPKSPLPHYALGRLHAMAYAKKTNEVSVNAKSGAPFYGFLPKRIPFDVVPAKEEGARAKARSHLVQAIRHYKKSLSKNPKFLAGQLGLAWATEQKGEKEKAKGLYREVFSNAFKTESKMKQVFGENWSIAIETSEYLLPLLDEKKDAAEMKKIRDQVAGLKRKPRAVTPILIPLSDEVRFEKLIDREKKVIFDLDGQGPKRWPWLKPNAGWLGFDPENRKELRSGLDLFGSVFAWIPWANGYEALCALDDDQDLQLRGKELDGLVVWQDSNQNATSEPQEVHSLSTLGIHSLRCDYLQGNNFPYHPHGVVLKDGSTRPSYDWVLTSK